MQYQHMFYITSILISLYLLIPLVTLVWRAVFGFLTDSQINTEVTMIYGKDCRPDYIVVHTILLVMVGTMVSTIWPLVYLLAVLTSLAYILRFLIRCGKSIDKLSQMSHDHSGTKGAANSVSVPRPKFTGHYD